MIELKINIGELSLQSQGVSPMVCAEATLGIDGVAIDICSEATSAIETLLGIISQTIDRPFDETIDFVTGVIKLHRTLAEDE